MVKKIINNNPLIRFDKVSFGYDEDNYCIKETSFDIYENEKVLFLGRNGQGKSTIAKLIDGILKQNKGDIYLFNQLVDDYNIVNLRKDIGLIFQNPDNQFIGSSVKDDIAFGLENHLVEPSKMDDIILYYLKRLGIEDLINSQPENLSGGQKQKVALASILAMKPKILILDEATSMLDPKSKKEINDFILSIYLEEKITLISITHEIVDIDFYDKIFLVDEGKVKIIKDKKNDIKFNFKLFKGIELPVYIKIQDKLNNNKLHLNASSEEELINKLCQLKLKN